MRRKATYKGKKIKFNEQTQRDEEVDEVRVLECKKSL
jgi:hypothetical protein